MRETRSSAMRQLKSFTELMDTRVFTNRKAIRVLEGRGLLVFLTVVSAYWPRLPRKRRRDSPLRIDVLSRRRSLESWTIRSNSVTLLATTQDF